VPAKALRIPIRSVKRIVVRAADVDIETLVNKYSAPRMDGPVMSFEELGHPLLYASDGSYVDIFNSKVLAPCVLERR
jgi:hypothetical protein